MGQPGTDAIFKIDNSADVLTEVAVNHGSEIGFTLDTVREDDTRFGQQWQSEDVILRNANGSINIRWANSMANLFYGVFGLKKDIEYGPTGTTAGDIKHTGKLLVATIDTPATVGSQTMVNVTLGPAGQNHHRETTNRPRTGSLNAGHCQKWFKASGIFKPLPHKTRRASCRRLPPRSR